MEERKLVPKRRFREFENKWKLQCFKEMADYRHGKAHERNVVVNGNYVIVNSKFISTNGKTEKFSNLQIEPLHEDEITFVLSDIPNGKALAKTYLISKNNRFTLNQRILGITPKRTMDSYFLKEYMNRHSYFLKFDDGANQTNLSNQDLENFKLRCPNIKEQQKIGEFFKVLDERIASQERKTAKVKALKDAYLTEMFPHEGETVPKRRFKGFEGEWKVTDLDSIGSTFSGLSGKTIKDFGHGTAEFVTYMNVFNNTLADLNNTEKVIYDNKETQLKYGDILFTTSSETPDEVGMSSVWLSDRPNVYLNSFCFGFRSNIKIDYYFIGYLLRGNEFRRKVEILAQGISRYNISKSKVMKLKINLPSIKEQQKIGQFFKNIDDQIEVEEKKLDKLQKMKEAYLEEMFL